ncbi:putative amp dependent CoA ligase [Xylariales sp. AK1849]|nr:putative amp dependent CoA ligase [Xylariales sp. AK1849]
MSIAFFLILVFLFTPSIRTYLRSFSLRRKRARDHELETADRLLEIDGGVWQQKSVFEYIECGLKKNPHGPAVICLFQPANHLAALLSGTPARHVDAWIHSRTIAVDWLQDDEDANCPSNKGSNNFQDIMLSRDGDHQRQLSAHNPSATDNTTSTQACSDLLTSDPTRCLTLTYGQLHGTAVRLAAGLLANGATPDTTMIMFIPNGGEYALLLWTCVLLRITYVCLDPSLLEISGFTRLKQIMQSLKPQLLVAPDMVAGKALDVAVTELQLAPPICVCLSSSGLGSGSGSGWYALADIAVAGDAALKKRIVDKVAMTEAARRDSATRIHSIMFTSGTSDLPKGCPLRSGGMAYALESQSWLLAESSDEDCSGRIGSAASSVRALMQPHNSRGIAPAQSLQTWRCGGAVVLTGQAFDVKKAINAIALVRATFIVLTPPMVHEMATALADRPGINISSVRTVQVGGDTVTKGLLERCAALFPSARVCVNHGMTEGPGSFMWPSSFSRLPISQLPYYGESICPVGSVAPGAVVRVCDLEKRNRNALTRGALGELHISSPSIIRHYWNGRSDESFYSDTTGRKWFKTGDIAMVDKDDVVFVLGRKKDIIRRAGVPIMPAAIESLIEGFTGSQTIVVTASHPVLGAEPFAVLGSYNGKTGQQIKECVRSILGNDYALGGVVSLHELGLADFPLNATHKVIKTEVHAAVNCYFRRTPNR